VRGRARGNLYGVAVVRIRIDPVTVGEIKILLINIINLARSTVVAGAESITDNDVREDDDDDH
jgi:hypothetical protein